MGYAIAGSPTSSTLQAFSTELAAELERAGFERDSNGGEAELV